MNKVKPIPDGVQVIMPMLVCRDAAAEIDFCKATFNAVELVRRPGPDGNVAHAALTIGGIMIMIEAEWPTLASRSPQPDGSSPVVIYVYVEDVDTVVERAVAAGAKVLLPVKDQFWGDRTGRIMDPAGHVWTVSTRIEETSSEKREERWSKIVKGWLVAVLRTALEKMIGFIFSKKVRLGATFLKWKLSINLYFFDEEISCYNSPDTNSPNIFFLQKKCNLDRKSVV